MKMDLSRRKLLTAFGLGAVPILATIGVMARTSIPRPHESPEHLLTILPDKDSAARIGAAWLSNHPELSPSASLLSKRLSARLRNHGWSKDGTTIAQRKAVARASRQEFLRGQIVDIRGWCLTITQVELCGLAYLTADDRS
jgi:hypothetical protein